MRMQKIIKLLLCLLFAKNVLAHQSLPPNNLEIIVENGSKTHAFKANEPVKLLVWVNNRDKQTFDTLRIKCQILGFNKAVLQTKEQYWVKILPNTKSDSLVFEFDMPTAGFYYSCVILDKNLNKPCLKGFSVEPEKIKSTYQAPKDFANFWKKTLHELKQVPPQYKVTLHPEFNALKTDVYAVEMRSLDNVRVHGWLVTPKGKKNLPAVVYFQGYTTNNIPKSGYLEITDFTQFFLDIRGHGSSNKDINPGFPAFLTEGIEDKDCYIFRGAYMDCIRSLDFLCTRPEVDAQKIAVWGGSMGGALSLVTAALDKRVKLCAFDLPFLSDFHNYFTLSKFPSQHFETYSATHKWRMDSIYAVLDYFDIKNFAPSVKCPTMMASGLFDETCPPAINFAAYNNIRSKQKQFYLMPDTGHGITSEHWHRFYQWCRDYWAKK